MVSVKKWLPFCARQGQIPRWLRDANWHARRFEDRRLREISRRCFVTADSPPSFIIRVSSREILPRCLPPFFSRLFARRNRKSRDQSNEWWTTEWWNHRLCGETWRSPIGRGDYNRRWDEGEILHLRSIEGEDCWKKRARTDDFMTGERSLISFFFFFFFDSRAMNLIVGVCNTLRIKKG